MLYFPDELPGWFTLAWDPKSPGIIIGMRKEIAGASVELLASSRAESYRDYLNARAPRLLLFEGEHRFIPFTEERCGFDGCLQRLQGENTHVSFSLPLPRVRRFLADPCPDCGGTGARDVIDCLACDGIGKRQVKEFGPLWVWCATMAVFSGWRGVFPPETLTPSNAGQWMVFENVLRDTSQYGAPLHAGMSPKAAQWLKQQGSSLGTRLAETMEDAHRHLWHHERPYSHCSVFFHPEDDYLVLRSGDASIGTQGHYRDEERLQYLEPHNTDGPIDQAVLLCGLAALYEAIDKGLQA